MPGSVQSAHTYAGHPDLHHGQLRGPCPVATHREESPGQKASKGGRSSTRGAGLQLTAPTLLFSFLFHPKFTDLGAPQLGSASSAPTGFTGDHMPAQGMRRTVARRLLRDLRPLLLGMLTSLGLAAVPGCLDGMSRPGVCLLTVTVPWLPIPWGRSHCLQADMCRVHYSQAPFLLPHPEPSQQPQHPSSFSPSARPRSSHRPGYLPRMGGEAAR